VFFFLALILLAALPHPWNLIGFVVAIVLFVGEVLFWHSRVRHKREATGADLMIGATAIVTGACRPRGQVRLRGETWEARCAAGADVGDEVVIRSREGLVLTVEPIPAT
jgi:membrane protein implicated in regulation of membrane protease activity